MTNDRRPRASAPELLSEIEAMLDEAHEKASMAWRGEDHEDILNQQRAKIAERLEQWRHE